MVWISQCLCPARHCIVANAGEAADAADAEHLIAAPLRAAVFDMLTRCTINPWCGLCNASKDSWRYETRRTRFATMAEAMPELHRLEAEQAVTSAIYGDMPRSD